MLQKALSISVLILATVTVYASPDAPEESVRQFYAAATSKNCALAIKLRPGFTQDRCEKLETATIRSLTVVSNDGNKAVVAADLGLESGGKPQDFKGSIHLQKQQGEWVLTEYEAATSTDMPPQQQAAPTTDVIGDNPAETLTMLRERFPRYAQGKIVLVDVDKQRMSIYQGQEKLGEFPVSTASKGVGSAAGSDKTPLGAHRISQKFGDDARKGTIFKARQDTGTLADIITEPKDVPADYVTTRILWLDGLEPGKNKGGSVDSQDRFIYIHGTPEEGLIGKPASHGCVRMKNDDVIRVYQLLDSDTLVYIGQ